MQQNKSLSYSIRRWQVPWFQRVDVAIGTLSLHVLEEHSSQLGHHEVCVREGQVHGQVT